ncbi:nose resistant to fluoxetine protein 6-like [Photinus pyralis]|uniref:nose resistant to fluoxetine protein 6-like n=1 Tax=Photinus pyralis TaxID=7054 RepID=UPI0012670929|nr:nose resistant to fluoxetine protein 6-like [Photinus pyralis]
MKRWAVEMYDASGKYPPATLDGNSFALGSLDQCINIAEGPPGTEISGKYCLGRVTPRWEMTLETKTATSQLDDTVIGYCIPSTCTAKEFESYYANSGLERVSELSCQTKKDHFQFDVGTKVVLTFFALWILWIIFSTAYDIVIQHLNKEPSHWLLVSFSCYTNTKRLFDITTDATEITCLHGLRVLTMIWIILVHHYLSVSNFPERSNYKEDFYAAHITSGIIATGAETSVNTFFLLSGLTLSYVFMRKTGKLGKFNLLAFYAHRYVRLTPTLGVIVLVYVFLLKYMGSGPLWPELARRVSAPCETNWWKTLLYIQNSDKYICVEQTWFLGMDTQLYFLSPLLLLPLLKKPRLALYVIGGLAMCCVALSIIPTLLFIRARSQYSPTIRQIHDWAPYNVAGPWLLGIILGYLIYSNSNRKADTNINKIYVVVIWTTAVAVILACMFYRFNDTALVAIAKPLRRTAWAVAVACIVYACQFGYGGIVNRFLSSKIFKFLSRISYSVFLSHLLIQVVVIEGMQMPVVISQSYLLEILLTNFAITLPVSILLTVTCESPLISIEKRILSSPRNQIKNSAS